MGWRAICEFFEDDEIFFLIVRTLAVSANLNHREAYYSLVAVSKFDKIIEKKVVKKFPMQLSN